MDNNSTLIRAKKWAMVEAVVEATLLQMAAIELLGSLPDFFFSELALFYNFRYMYALQH